MAGRVVAGALLAFVVGVGADGCSKSPPKSDGGDASIGEGGVDVRTDGRDSGVDAPPCTAAAKATGMPCGCKAECASGFCVDGVCCAEACAGGCKTCAAPNSLGHVRQPDRGRDAARFDDLHDDARVDLRLRRQMRRRRRLPQVPGEHDVQARHVRRRRRRRLVRLRRQRAMQAGPDAHLRAVLVQRGHRRLRRRLHDQQPVRQRPSMQGRKLRPADDRRDLPAQRPVRFELLRRRGLLQRRLPGTVPQLQPDGTRGHLLARRRRQARPARHLPGHGAVDLRSDRPVRRHRQLLEVRARHGVHRLHLLRHPPQHRRRPATASAPAGPRASRTAIRSAARTARARPRAPPAPTAPPGSPA